MKRFGLGVFAAAAITTMLAAADRNPDAERLLKAAMNTELVDGNIKAAIDQYKRVAEVYSKSDRTTAAQALLHMAQAYQKLGDAQVRQVYERLVREFADQKDAVAEAQSRLAALLPLATAPARSIARYIATEREDVSGAMPSADGRYLSFAEPATGDMVVRDLTTGANRRITNTGGWASDEYTADGVVSHDGRQIAWTHYDHKVNHSDLRVTSTVPGESDRFTVALRAEVGEGAYRVAWMPDGKRLVVVRSRQDKTSSIGIVTIQDASFRSIKSLEWRSPNRLSLSPDGRYVAYDVPAGDVGSPLDIFVLATDGSRETAVVKNPANDSHPLWSPDGRSLIFLSDRSGNNAIWMVPIEDGRAAGQATLMKPDVGAIRLVGLTKSGTLFYTEPTTTRANVYVADLDGVRATKPATEFSERLATSNIGPTWSRDGEYLAYYSFRDAPVRNSFTGMSGVLVVRSAKSGEERTVPLPTRVSSRFSAGPKWFPDNRSVLVEVGDAQGSGFGFYRLALDTGNIEPVVHVANEVIDYDLSRDGRSIFYVIGNASGDQKLMRFDIESHRDNELRSNPFGPFETTAEIVAMAASPDGQQVAMTIMGGSVEVVAATGGQARELFRPAARDLGTGALRQALGWTPDQRFVVFTRGDGSFWKVPALGGQAEPVGLSKVKSPAVHPDGKRLVFSSGGGASAKVWALDNALPRASTRP